MSNVIPLHGRRRGGKLAAGQLFAGRYCLLQRVGHGGMGDVWTAADEKTARVVALKLLHPGLLLVPGYTSRFERESRALARLEHPYVVPLYDWGTEPQPFIVMKRILGITLREMMRERGRVHWIAAVCFVMQTAEGLAAIHRLKLWHRDLKPENVMVDEEGNVSIIDLGIAREAGVSRGETTDRIGTRGYLPPEMILCRPTDHRGDLYQLGVMLYELLTGRKPYGSVDESDDTEVQAAHVHQDPDAIRDRVRDCPEELEAIVMRLLAKDPEERFQSARELGAALGEVLKKRGSVPSGDALEPLVLRAMVRRKQNSLAAEARAAEEEAEAEEREAAKLEAVRQEHTEPREERQRLTLKLGSGFVPQSPASPSARAAAVAAGGVVERRQGVLDPAVAVPEEEAATKKLLSVRQAGVWPAARVPVERVPAAMVPAAVVPARTRPTRDLGSVARVTIRIGIAVLALATLVLLVRALGVRVEVTRTTPVVRAAPVVSTSAALPPSAPSLPSSEMPR